MVQEQLRVRRLDHCSVHNGVKMTKHGQTLNHVGLSAQMKEDKTFSYYLNILDKIIIGLTFEEINL